MGLVLANVQKTTQQKNCFTRKIELVSKRVFLRRLDSIPYTFDHEF